MRAKGERCRNDTTKTAIKATRFSKWDTVSGVDDLKNLI